MARPKRQSVRSPSRLTVPSKSAPSSESRLLVQRIKELDREFARQTKQLTDLTKEVNHKIKRKLTGRK